MFLCINLGAQPGQGGTPPGQGGNGPGNGNGNGNGNGPPCPRPNGKPCKNIPIDSGVEFLIISGVIIGATKIYRKNKKKRS